MTLKFVLERICVACFVGNPVRHDPVQVADHDKTQKNNAKSLIINGNNML